MVQYGYLLDFDERQRQRHNSKATHSVPVKTQTRRRESETLIENRKTASTLTIVANIEYIVFVLPTDQITNYCGQFRNLLFKNYKV